MTPLPNCYNQIYLDRDGIKEVFLFRVKYNRRFNPNKPLSQASHITNNTIEEQSLALVYQTESAVKLISTAGTEIIQDSSAEVQMGSIRMV